MLQPAHLPFALWQNLTFKALGKIADLVGPQQAVGVVVGVRENALQIAFDQFAVIAAQNDLSFEAEVNRGGGVAPHHMKISVQD